MNLLILIVLNEKNRGHGVMDSIGGYEPLDLGSNPGALANSMNENKLRRISQ